MRHVWSRPPIVLAPSIHVPMDLDGFLDEKEAMPVQGPRDRSTHVHISLGDECTGRSFWSRVWVLVGAAKDPKRFHTTFDGRLFCRSRDQIGWINRFPWGLGRTSVPLAKSKRRRAGRCPPRKGKNHSPFAGPSPCRRRGSDSDGARPEQSDPVVANALQSVEDDPLTLESIESMKKSTPYPSLHQIPILADTAAEGNIVEKTGDDDYGERAERIELQALFQSK
ncbi:uncharacterized protein B0T23DRAFT_132740 [Neurospora hispaniola]|uniref:Uncharacterized protein n=1 Tax=Neurospora hispaniola TaxID=588809 RepID=A0AAJ0MQW7_9PEZI|nr:hypothetical protein B0T23DRAFT_132740 [Neurospora hispaniola]